MNFLTSYQQSKIKEIIRNAGVRHNTSDNSEYTIFLVLDALISQNKELEKTIKDLELKVKRLS